MSTSVDQPIPKDLRTQMLKRLESMPDEDVTELYELTLLQEKLRLRREISADAEREQAAGLWSDLPEFIRAYRAAKRSA